MGRTARKKDDDVEEVKAKDFAGAVKAWRHDIKPNISKVGEHNQEVATAYKHIKKNCHIQPQAAKLVFKLDGMEDAHRDDWIRCFTGLCKELNISLNPVDLVDMAESDGEEQPRPKPTLVTLPMGVPSDGTETDLADAGEEPFEASEAELAQQEGRGKSKPKAGTGEAARAAMKEAGQALPN